MDYILRMAKSNCCGLRGRKVHVRLICLPVACSHHSNHTGCGLQESKLSKTDTGPKGQVSSRPAQAPAERRGGDPQRVNKGPLQSENLAVTKPVLSPVCPPLFPTAPQPHCPPIPLPHNPSRASEAPWSNDKDSGIRGQRVQCPCPNCTSL